MTGKSLTINLTIPPEAWEPNGPLDDPTARLYGAGADITINGVSFHLEAIAVDRDADGGQYALCDADTYDGLLAAADPDGGFQPMTIHGRRYVVFLTPHSE